MISPWEWLSETFSHLFFQDWLPYFGDLFKMLIFEDRMKFASEKSFDQINFLKCSSNDFLLVSVGDAVCAAELRSSVPPPLPRYAARTSTCGSSGYKEGPFAHKRTPAVVVEFRRLCSRQRHTLSASMKQFILVCRIGVCRHTYIPPTERIIINYLPTQ